MVAGGAAMRGGDFTSSFWAPYKASSKSINESNTDTEIPYFALDVPV